MNISIAMDGPSGAGKSTVASQVAARLGILHLDTGAMYRAFAWHALQMGIDTKDEAALGKLTQTTTITVELGKEGQRTLVNGKDVSGLIRTPEISMATSDISRFAGVRSFMVRRQQELAKASSMILDGRDIGVKVLPQATLKVFLTASPEVRARRRFKELTAGGETITYESVLEDVQQRDLQDSTREIDPLAPAEGAIILDTSAMSQEEAVDAILNLLKERKGANEVKKERFSWSYRLAIGLSSLVFRTILPVRYHHVEKAQINAPYILIGNHQSMLDPLIAGWKCSRYQIRFFGKKELVKNPILRALFRSLRMIPVDRHNMDMAAVRQCMKTLKEGHPLCIFPEGTRHKQGVMEDLESGVALIALRAKVPLLPALIAPKPRFFHRLDCYFGDPIPVDRFAADGIGKESCDALLAEIRRVYGEMKAAHEAAGGKAWR